LIHVIYTYMNKKKYIIFILITVLFVAGGAYLFVQRSHSSLQNEQYYSKTSYIEALHAFSLEHPELSEFTTLVDEEEAKIAAAPSNTEGYLSLGLAWKSLADRAGDPPNMFYEAAFEVYKRGIELTDRRDTTFLKNAANMAEFQKDFDTSETLLQEAIVATPGDADLYIRLADVYTYLMKKPTQEIIDFLDTGIEILPNATRLENYKKRLETNEQSNNL